MDNADVFGESKMQSELEAEAKAEVNELRTAESFASRTWNSTLHIVGLGRKDAPKETPQTKVGSSIRTNTHAI